VFVHLSLIVLLILVGLYWSGAQAVKERAQTAVEKHCQAMEVQMLDGYVALKYWGLRRNESGVFKIARTFGFEFSATGAERYNGRIMLLGQKIERIEMEPYRLK